MCSGTFRNLLYVPLRKQRESPISRKKLDFFAKIRIYSYTKNIKCHLKIKKPASDYFAYLS